MNDFWMNFGANLAADAILAFAIYYIVTQPQEQKKTKQRFAQALGLLKSEAEINRHRAHSYISDLEHPTGVKVSIFPLRFTRGAWNALRESGFISEIDDLELAYYLFRMNEIGLVANKNLRRFELAHLEDTGGRVRELGNLARQNCIEFHDLLEEVLNRMKEIEAVSINEPDTLSIFSDVDEDELAG